MLSISALLLSAALLLAMVLNLALKPAFNARLNTACMLAGVLGGLLFYGTGHMEATGDLLLSVIRTPLSVVRMFVGVNELSAIAGSRLVSSRAGLLCFWVLHLLAFYSMASAAMHTLGAEALRQLRLWLSNQGDLTLIYGLNEESIALGKERLSLHGASVVFVAEAADNATVTSLNNLGMSALLGQEAVDASPRCLRRLRADKRKLSVYALEQEDKALGYALRLREGLEALGASPEQTRLTLPGEAEILSAMLQVSEERYGFGYVNAYKTADLAARTMIRLCPPWEQLRFGPDGCAQEDFSCVVIGFDRFGQAALRQLVMNGQFAGSRFRAAIFSPDLKNESGYLLSDCPELLQQYDICGYSEDARGEFFYDYLSRNLDSLKLIAVCTGQEERDREISDKLMLYLKHRQAEQICVVRCGHSGVQYQPAIGSPITRLSLYSEAVLSEERADRSAILLNGVYDDSPRSDWEKWLACPPFSKMSSRASADFLPAFLKAAGLSREALLAGDWQPDEELLESLGETEHLRWCAFHFAMGYRPMRPEVFAERAKEYVRRREAGQLGGYRIAKDPETRTHACLIPWEELDELSAKENEITGGSVDYKQYDIDNVLALPELLSAEAQGTAE